MTSYPGTTSYPGIMTSGRHYDLVSWDAIMISYRAIMTSYPGTPL